MTLRWLPLDALEPHQENANRMPPDLFEKLKGHIARTGRYEPIVVRPIPVRSAEYGVRSKRQNGAGRAREGISGERRRGLPPAAHDGTRCVNPARKRGATGVSSDIGPARYQILNGHHRARVLRELGYKRARCDVWDVDDEEARLLVATLNRLEGRDDPKARARLVARLAAGRSAEDLSRLLPEPPDAVERLLRLAEPPPEPAAADSLEPLPQALTFFLSEEQHALVSEALKEVQNAECRVQNAERTRLRPGGTSPGQAANGGAREGVGGERDRDPRSRLERRGSFEPPAAHGEAGGDGKRLGRAERLERLALWYLESVGRR